MNVVICPKATYQGVISAPTSKSEAHRMLICAALSDSETKIYGQFSNEDIKTTINVLKQLGASIETNDEYLVVKPIRNLDNQENIHIFANESGSTLRFIIPVIAILNKSVEIDGRERLRERPIKEIIDCLKEQGITFSGEKLPLKMSGKVNEYNFRIDASKSSQYISGLLLAGGFIKEDVNIEVTSEIVSSEYIDITIDIMNKFGVKVEKNGNKYVVKGQYKSPKEINCAGDWSGATYMFILGLMGKVTVKNLDINTKQGDKRILDVLRTVGAKIEVSNNEITVEKGQFNPFNIDADANIDMVPALASLASICNGVSEIRKTERLKIKESDRQKETIKMLESFGVKCWLEEETIKVNGGIKANPECITLPNDHRIAMATALLCSFINEKTTLIGMECINKSYPQFLEDYKSLGGKVDVLNF